MRTKKITLYLFDELPEKAQAKALERYYDFDVDGDWWDACFDDANTIGLKITGFDTGRSNDITGELLEGANETARLILDNHGKDTPTYKLAAEWFADKHRGRYIKDNYGNGTPDLNAIFLKDLLECYLVMLRDEYEYLTEPEHVAETLRLNEYEFNEKGEIDR